MKRYAIIDIGSNTVVLVIYEVEGSSFQQIHSISTPCHLVDEIQNSHMMETGLQKLRNTVSSYVRECALFAVDEVHAEITACGRGIDNANEMIQIVQQSGVNNVVLLSGEEEALCSYYASRLDNDIENGIMIDIGGGSTEFVAFENCEVKSFASIPLGCVRLSHYPDDPSIPMQEILKMVEKQPAFSQYAIAVGIGGTVRACKKICKAVYHQKKTFTTSQLEDLYQNLVNRHPAYVQAMHEKVQKDRLAVFIPGLTMLVAAARHFNIETFHNSDYGVREGFLLRYVLHDINCRIKQ